jgi:hypothetical protein
LEINQCTLIIFKRDNFKENKLLINLLLFFKLQINKALYMCNSVHALSCYTTNQGAGGLGASLACATNTGYCYVSFSNKIARLNYFLLILIIMEKNRKRLQP